MAKISVIIPVYNVEKYLEKCLESVLGQTFKDLEIICVNDGSTDNSLQILENFAKKDSRIKIITQVNQGLSGARNTGLLNATSKLIAFLDSDDYFHPTALEKAYNQMKGEIDVVSFYSKVVNDGLEENSKSVVDNRNYHVIRKNGCFKINDKIVAQTTVTCWNKLFKKEIIDKYDLKFPKGLYFEDNPFTVPYLCHSREISFIGEYLHYYVQRPGSIMEKAASGLFKHSDDNLKVFDLIYNHLDKHCLLKEFKTAITCAYSAFLFNGYNFAPKNSKADLMQIARGYAVNYNPEYFSSPALKYVQKGEFKKVHEFGGKPYPKPFTIKSFFQNIFSIRNEENNSKKHKVICILGLKFKIKINKGDNNE